MHLHPIVTVTTSVIFMCSSLIILLFLSHGVVAFSSSHRAPFITGNWKLNPTTKQEAIQLAQDIAACVKKNPGEISIALFVPFPFIECVQKAVGNKVIVGAQMSTPQIKGAFTGAISIPMLQSIGVNWVLAGHSERRTINKESDDYINEQCIKIIENGMNVILCIGESLTEFEKNLAGPICAIQLKKGLAGISKENMKQVAIAYEPVWAIGTGKVATPEIAQTVHAACRHILADMYDLETANQVCILYGGSVTPESVDGLMAKPDIDGCLVGGASLAAEKFGRIINYIPPIDSASMSRPANNDPEISITEQPTLSRLSRLTNSIKKILRKVV